MKDNQKHIEPDYNVLLRKYVAGDISKSERFALEKRALDDPFVAEALEGLRLEKEADFSAALDRINKSVLAEEGQKKRPVFWNWRLAASIAASLIIVSVIGYQIMDSGATNQEMIAATPAHKSSPKAQEVPEIASVLETEQEDLDLDKTIDEASADIDNRKIEQVEEIKKLEVSEASVDQGEMASEELDIESNPAEPVVMQNGNTTTSSNTPTASKAKNTRAKRKTAPAAAEDDMFDAVKVGDVNDEVVLVPEAAPPSVKKEAAEMDADAMAKNVPATLIKLTGQIIDADQTPLIGASIVMLDSQVGVNTDVDGNFTLEVSDLPVELVVSYTGFGNEYRIISDTTTQTIVMQEHAILNEVVVTNAGNIELDDVSQSTGHPHRAQPKSGFFVLEEFIKDNRYQSMEDKNAMSGYVLVGFTITTDGETKNLRIISSNCRACHDRAKWLIENSGLWLNNSASDIQATYQISF